MSRSGLHEDDGDGDILCYGRWRGAVRSAIRGKVGQAFLREVAAALDAMPDKRLIEGDLQAEGSFCTVGAVMCAKGIDATQFDTHDYDAIAAALGVNAKVIQELEWQNDEGTPTWHYVEHCGPPAPSRGWWSPRERIEVREPDPDAGAERWRRMRAFVESQIIKDTEA